MKEIILQELKETLDRAENGIILYYKSQLRAENAMLLYGEVTRISFSIETEVKLLVAFHLLLEVVNDLIYKGTALADVKP